jgi:hypothetical protein
MRYHPDDSARGANLLRPPRPRDGATPRLLAATVAYLANRSGEDRVDEIAVALVAALRCLPLEAG